jgi:hypothetical protein
MIELPGTGTRLADEFFFAHGRGSPAQANPAGSLTTM